MKFARVILLAIAFPAPQNFSTLSHKWNDFEKKKKKLLNIIVCFDLPYSFVYNYSHSKNK